MLQNPPLPHSLVTWAIASAVYDVLFPNYDAHQAPEDYRPTPDCAIRRPANHPVSRADLEIIILT